MRYIVEWFLEMAMNTMLELMNLLGFKDDAKMFNMESGTGINAVKNILPQFPPKQLTTPSFKQKEHI